MRPSSVLRVVRCNCLLGDTKSCHTDVIGSIFYYSGVPGTVPYTRVLCELWIGPGGGGRRTRTPTLHALTASPLQSAGTVSTYRYKCKCPPMTPAKSRVLVLCDLNLLSCAHGVDITSDMICSTGVLGS